MPLRNDWQALFHPGLRGYERVKSCSLKDLAILLRNSREINVYGIEPRNTADAGKDFVILAQSVASVVKTFATKRGRLREICPRDFGGKLYRLSVFQ